MKPRVGGLLAALLWLHQVAIAYLSPLSSQDWVTQLNAPPWRSLSRLYHWVIVKSHLVHVVVTPLIVVALPLGLATLVRGRRLRADRDDTLLFATIASALWLAIPRFGLACSYRLAVATHVLGLTAAVWYVVWVRATAARARAGTAIDRRAAIGLVLAGVAVGSTTWQVSIATITACVAIARRTGDTGPRRWRAVVLGGLIAGTALARWSELGALANHFHVFAGRFDAELQDFEAQIRAPAWVGVVTAVIWLVHTAWRYWRGRVATPFDPRDLDVILYAIGFAAMTALIGIATADFVSFQAVVPGAAVAAIAAVTIVQFAGTDRARLGVIGLVLAVQAPVMIGSIVTLLPAHRQFDQRVAALRRAPHGTIATVAPYPPDITPWFFGEDFQTSSLRDRVATMEFGLRGIALVPGRPEFQDVPRLALHHQVDGDPSGLPAFYSADLATARRQFTTAIRRRPGNARLIVDGVVVPDHPAEPVLAAWTDGATRMQWWTITSRDPDRDGRLRLVAGGEGLTGAGKLDPVLAMWAFDLATGAGQTLSRGDDGAYRLPVQHRSTDGIVACSAARCALLGVITQH